jgi:exportin-2 (importin alpha re-exporter)
MFMQAYLRRGAAYLAANASLVPLLGIWQNLLATKNQEDHAFALLDALFEGAPLTLFTAYLGPVLDLLCKKLQSSKSAK